MCREQGAKWHAEHPQHIVTEELSADEKTLILNTQFVSEGASNESLKVVFFTF